MHSSITIDSMSTDHAPRTLSSILDVRMISMFTSCQVQGQHSCSREQEFEECGLRLDEGGSPSGAICWNGVDIHHCSTALNVTTKA